MPGGYKLFPRLKAENAARDKAIKDSKTFVVVEHLSNDGKPTNTGYVVRTATDGVLPAPYRDAKRVKETKREADAQRHADKLNKER